MPTRILTVGRADAGRTVAALFRRHLHLSWDDTRRATAEGRVRLNGSQCPDGARKLRAGDRLELRDTSRPRPAAKPFTKSDPVVRLPAGVGTPTVVYLDADVVVVDKPPGLTTMRHPEEAAEFGERGRRFLPATLMDWLPGHLGSPGRSLRAVHRIDRDTSGLVVFARTPAAERHLSARFRDHAVTRRYLALTRGTPTAERIASRLVRDRGDGRRGGTSRPEDGQHAVTHVRTLESLGDFALVECRLETGRTHQVRIHLGEHGTPLCGERVYDRPIGGPPLPDGSGATRPMLHAAVLGFDHPNSGERLEWTAEPSADFAELLRRLRGTRPGGA